MSFSLYSPLIILDVITYKSWGNLAESCTVFRLGAIQIIRDTLGGRWVAKMSHDNFYW
jgi:hypothetical protein